MPTLPMHLAAPHAASLPAKPPAAVPHALTAASGPVMVGTGW
ncbi:MULTISPECIES: hypothetical protein [Streptomyces]